MKPKHPLPRALQPALVQEVMRRQGISHMQQAAQLLLRLWLQMLGTSEQRSAGRQVVSTYCVKMT